MLVECTSCFGLSGLGLGFGVWRLWFGDWPLGFVVCGVVFGVESLAFGLWANVWRLAYVVWSLAFGVGGLWRGVWCWEFGVWALGFGVWGFAFGVWSSIVLEVRRVRFLVRSAVFESQQVTFGFTPLTLIPRGALVVCSWCSWCARVCARAFSRVCARAALVVCSWCARASFGLTPLTPIPNCDCCLLCFAVLGCAERSLPVRGCAW